MLEKVAIGALFYSIETKRILFNLRSEHKTFGQCWSLWGGMSEDNETSIETLRRELSEEMGFVPEIAKIYPFDIYESKDGHFRYYSFVCIVPNEFTPILNSESDGYAWLNYLVWPKPMHTGAKKSFLTKKGIEKLELIISQHR